MDQPYCNRAAVVPLDPSPSQAQLLRSYCGASRFAYNWAIATVKENLNARSEERGSGVADADLTPMLSWSAYSMTPLWNSVKDDVAPWHRNVTMHAFRSGVTNASTALKNFAQARSGARRGRAAGFPRFKNRHSKLSVTFVDLQPTAVWFSEDSHSVRLILPRFATDPRITRRRDQLQWIHTTESLTRLKRKVALGEWTVQAVTFSFTGGRWQASFSVRQLVESSGTPVQLHGLLVGVDLRVKHLATLSMPVRGLTDQHGHIPNPRHLDAELERLATLNRRLARCVKGSENRAKLVRRRPRLYGRITRTRDLYLHRLTTTLAGRFEAVALEDLKVSGLVTKSKANTNSTPSRRILDAGFSELRRQLTYKAADRGHHVVVVDRFHPSSKKCSSCGETKAKLALSGRLFECSNCGTCLDRDVNAARNSRDEGLRLLKNEPNVAGHEPETLNADSRDCETELLRQGRKDRYQGRTTQPL